MASFLEIEREKERSQQWLRAHNQHIKSKAIQDQPTMEEMVKSAFKERYSKYSAFYIRSMDDFKIKGKSGSFDKHLEGLIKHMFFKYSLPVILKDVFFLKEKMASLNNRRQGGVGRVRNNRHATVALPSLYGRIDFIEWGLLVTQGRSLYKEMTVGFLSKRETFLFQKAPPSLMPHQAIVYAISMAESNNSTIAMMLSYSKISEVNLLNDFWLNAIRFFSQERRQPRSKQEAEDFVDYLRFRHNENNEFNLLGSGYTRESLARQKEAWHRHLARMRVIGDETWAGVNLPDSEFKISKCVWNFHQIKGAKELGNEGTAMRHCVASYKNQCISGQISVWSVTMQDVCNSLGFDRQMTLEVRGRTIVQARRRANRNPNPEDWVALKFWAKQNCLDISI